MKNVKLFVRAEEITLTADDWNLYDIDGRDEVAKKINIAVMEIYNNFPEASAWGMCAYYMEEFSEYGTKDLETLRVLNNIHVAVYPHSPIGF